MREITGRSARLGAWQAMLAAGVIAGSVDIFAAALIGGLNPLVVLHAIASGLLGRAAFLGGGWSAILGLLLQWVMGVVIAGIYISLTRHLPAFRRHWIASGAGYGAAIYLVMNLLVVPLSAAPFRPQFTPAKIIENLLAMLLFGCIVSFTASRVSRPTVREDRSVARS